MSVPVIGVAQMREWEKASWAAGRTEAEVIQRVGQVLAQRALEMTQSGDRILILAGKGHNGDDARCARAHLDGRRVECLDAHEPDAAFSKLDANLLLRPALVIDGLFGIGINRDLDQPWIRFIERINNSGLRVLAVDIPSGLNADDGRPAGAAIEASVTLTVGAPKRGMLEQEAWQYVGRLEIAADVGLVPCPIKSDLEWTLRDDFADFPPRRPVADHKGDHGHLAILAGSLGYHGAAVLAARAAQRAQPGLVTVFAHEPAYIPIAAQLQGAMVHPWTTGPNLGDNFSAVLVGPGLAAPGLPEELKGLVVRLWTAIETPVVVDASALAWLPSEPPPKSAIRVITPHPGEAARLLKTNSAQIQAHRAESLRELSSKFGDCWVVLKGHQTLIGRSTGQIWVNSSGNPHLAQGGAGDVLGGYMAGLLAQPALAADAARTLRYAAWQHGFAADLLQRSRSNWTVEDLVGSLNYLPLQGIIC